jgi:hypothetical protein
VLKRLQRPKAIVVMSAVLAAFAAIGCTGSIDGATGTPTGNTGNPMPNPGQKPGPSTGPTTPPGGDRPAAHMNRLTASQYANSLCDLLGGGVPVGTVDPDFPDDGFVSVGASSVGISPAGTNLHEASATAASTRLFADPARLTAAVPTATCGSRNSSPQATRSGA